MSKFFGSDSDSSETSSDEEAFTALKAQPIRAFLPSSDEEEELKRVVKSEKEKRYEGLTDIVKQLKNHKKIKDMAKCLDDFERLVKQFEKSKKLVQEDGLPRFYVRALADLDDFVNECWEDRNWRKGISKANAKGLSTLRQKLRKYIRENFEKEVAAYKENPEGSEEVESESDEDEKKPTTTSAPAAKTFAASKFLKASKDEDSDSDWQADSDDSELSSDDEKYEGNLAAKFLKRTPAQEKDKKVKKEKPITAKKKERDSEDEEWQTVAGGVKMPEKKKLFADDQKVNHKVILEKLSELIASRGKKSTDRSEQIELLVELLGFVRNNSLGPALELKVMFQISAAIYDYNPNISHCMKPEMFEKCMFYVSEELRLLKSHPEVHCVEHTFDDEENVEDASQPYRVRGSVLTLLERLCEEFTKTLQAADAHSTEYIDRLKEEPVLFKLLLNLERYLEGAESTSESDLCRVYIKHILMIYYKVDYAARDGKLQEGEKSIQEEMQRLCTFIYKNDQSDRIRARAVLCHIYHHAIHDRWYLARDLMLMSHMQQTIEMSDISLQILYNRAMVQLGLCGFRAGNVREAHHCLVDIQSSGRAKELLAQGISMQRAQQKSAEEEKKERQRQVPYHMHINSELLECVYLVSAMLSEIPYMAAHEMDARRRMISKNFHHVLRQSERQTLNGPPENMREHIVAASKAMRTGDWEACNDFIINEKMNAKIWNLFHDSDSVKALITGKIKEESLRTYLLTYSSVYDSLSLPMLADMYNLDQSKVHSIVSKMIINDELQASLDEPSQCLVMHRSEPSRVQAVALQMADKVAALVESNERAMEAKQGSFYQRGGQGNQRDADGGDRQPRNILDKRDGGGARRWGRGGMHHSGLSRNQHDAWGRQNRGPRY